ncbi:DNA polymerase-3 subunit delta' [Marinobacter daqiaonensis]|uniref:DNA-directed DNA polymerase n=1 Tax=Marinobacter daqiaonensis TaxID=650891 RepID=A0A1I6GWL0_9GAMM|nr:DNA polymerase III subunit delta' [Marinobacter daqiaonensis]SFR46582.1 DNA polymerase-3 subunit delta' [Marinobacter daqiaonensis]
MLNSMLWLEPVLVRFAEALTQERLPHATLVTGERGVGKRALADAMAALLVCEQRNAGDTRPCGTCRQCQLIEGQSHPDIRVYQPEKSRMVRIDQVRALSQFAVASPQVARYKVAILDRADQLNINAANALLKTLEEPAADVVLILLQETGRPVLPTIRSRCRVTTVATPTVGQAMPWLSAELAAAETVASEDRQALALNLAGGAPRLALDYLTGEFLDQRESALEAFRQFMKGATTVAAASRAFRELGHEATLNLMENWASDLARVMAGGEARDPGIAEVVRYLGSANPPWRAHQLVDAIRDSRRAMVNNVNPELETDRLLIQWQQLMPGRKRAG